MHLRALGGVLLGRPAKWKVTNAGGDGARSLWAVMPLVAIMLLNGTAIVVGVLVMADPGPTWLSVGWAAMIVLILGRMIIESVTGGRIRSRATPPVAAPATPRPPTVGESATKVIAVAAVG